MIENLFMKHAESSDGLITLGRRSVLKASGAPIVGFMNVLSQLRGIEERTGKQQIFIWILEDIPLDLNDEDSIAKFLSIQDLRARYTAVKMFSASGTPYEGLWEWLKARAVVVVYKARKRRRPQTLSLLRNTPIEWENSDAYQELSSCDFFPAYAIFINCDFPNEVTTIGHANSPNGIMRRELPTLPRGISSELLSIYSAARAFISRSAYHDGVAPLTGELSLSSLRGKGLSFYEIPSFLRRC
jgi:hypothetical protein